MSYVLTLDFETRDPSIGQRKGAGWVFEDFEILGAAYQIDTQSPEFLTDMDQLKEIVTRSKTIICHNAQYDIGCLHRLKVDYKDKLLIDTMILAKLYDNTLMSYSLDSLGKDFLGDSKDYGVLEQAADLLGIKKPMANIATIFRAVPEVVAQYAKQDVALTYRLSQWFKAELYEDALALIPFYSDLIKALVKWRARGVRIDLEQAERSSTALQNMHDAYLAEFYTYCPNVNIESTKQLAEAFTALGLVPGRSPKGGPSVDSKWRQGQDHPAILALDKAKKYQKLNREFVEGILERVENGRIYPELNIMGAAETGRFSSSNPNIQQIPKRDEIAAEYIRSLILPEIDQQLYALDFSSQEPRLQVHYAYLASCEGAASLKDEFDRNPTHDLHQQVADLAGIDRKQAKTINLGMSYGMGIDKLAVTLKLPPQEARELINKYKKMTPYLYQLNKAAQAAGSSRGYIKTLLGRRLKMDYEKPYKALNKIIQGSAADQTAMAMVQAYRDNIDLMFSVHDELVLSSSSPETARRLKTIMETIAPLEVTCYTEITYGPSWGQLSHLR